MAAKSVMICIRSILCDVLRSMYNCIQDPCISVQCVLVITCDISILYRPGIANRYVKGMVENNTVNSIQHLIE